MRWYRFAILFLLAGYNSHAQISYYNFTVNDGLPSNETYCVLQDRQGYIWIGTDHGVARYDGHEFKTFTTENGLTDNTVFLLKEDKQGKIWCLTFSGGVCYYDGRNFKPHPDNDTIKAICKREIPTSWAITGNGDLWLGFHRTGICKFSGHQTRIFEFGAKPILADSSEFVILNLKDNELVYTSVPVGSNLNATDSDIKSVVHFSLPQKLIGGLTKNFALIRLNNGAFAVSQWKEFVYVENGKATASLKFPSKTEITTSQSLDGKSIWILVQNGASYCIRPQNGSMQIIDSLILTNAATGIITDNQGNNWVSTLNAGLLMIQNPGIKLFDFRRQGIDNRAYSFKQFGNYLYVGLSQNCYFKIDTLFKGEFKQGKRFPSAVLDFAPDKRNDVITDVDLSVKLNDLLIFRCMLPMDSGYLLGAGAGGIVILNREFQTLFNSQHVGFKNRVNRLAKIAPSRYAIGTNVGLYYFDTRAGFEITEEKFFKNTRITSCKALNDSVYAVATHGKGVFLL
jgi:ligand-binding sensor domain-containing protein